MATYLVRTIDDHDLVGIFAASNFEELIVLVDECLDPANCEYQWMKSGGIMWEGPAVPIPIQTTEEQDEDPTDNAEPGVPWAGASLSESWWDSFYGHRRGRWKEFFPNRTKQTAPAASSTRTGASVAVSAPEQSR